MESWIVSLENRVRPFMLRPLLRSLCLPSQATGKFSMASGNDRAQMIQRQLTNLLLKEEKAGLFSSLMLCGLQGFRY